MILRPYQRAAVDAVYAHLRTRDDNPCVVIPTGGGKTPIIAQICRDSVEKWDGRVVVLTHVKELLEQTVERIMAFLPTTPVGVYCAAVNRRDAGYAITVGTIQSVWQKADAIGPADLVLVDEAHMIPLNGDGGDGMYRSFLTDLRRKNPRTRIVGLTATPFRTRGGLICGAEDSGAILNAVCHEVGVRELTDAGYLAPLVVERAPKGSGLRVNFGEIKVRGGEFVSKDAERVVGEEHAVVAWVDDLVERTPPGARDSTLIFASGVAHGERIVRAMRERHNIECGFVSAKTPDAQRAATLRRFAEGSLRHLCNVGVLTTGYDAPRIDCVALMRPTMSPGLYCQMVGRGLRVSPETGKQDCLVLDYGENAVRHGLIDSVRLEPREDSPAARECPNPACATILPADATRCPRCGRELPPPKRRMTRTGGGPVWAMVDAVEYFEHTKRDGSGRPTMRVEYRLAGGGSPSVVREWVCFDHPLGGFARRKAEHWWSVRSRTRLPGSVREAVALACAGALAVPRSVTYERPKGERYDRITNYELGVRPPAIADADAASIIRAHAEAEDEALLGDIPF